MPTTARPPLNPSVAAARVRVAMADLVYKTSRGAAWSGDAVETLTTPAPMNPLT